ncbi:unnamed protein product [Mytilus coruscus]|uniref:C1q domain-containing protein n=1 Tax=Mytilus coruscus TaxID=42192 RepID=A0A6J8A464_MYTCO|nr:unnamed protein product [Mytilus coruscus]
MVNDSLEDKHLNLDQISYHELQREKDMFLNINVLRRRKFLLRLRRDTRVKSNYVDKSLAILTSQLEQTFYTLELSFIKCENQSITSKVYESLEQKYVDLERKDEDLERKYSQLQSVNNEFNFMKCQLVSVQNQISEISKDVIVLKQTGSIKPLQEIQTLQQAVERVSAQTHSLSVNERARSQDFLALYNMTINSKRALSKLNTNTSNHLKNFETKTSNQLFNLEHRQNTTAADISSKFQAIIELNTNTSNQLKNLEAKTNKQLLKIEQSQNLTAANIITRMKSKETSDNLTFSIVQKQINKNAERVAMTADLSSGGPISNTIIKFDDVKFSVGITNLPAFRNTCEQGGLYIISASVLSITDNAYYYISLNWNDISRTYIGQHSGNNGFTGAVTITRELNQNDQIWLYAPGSWYVYSGMNSKLTIIKIK